jgi:hypothetical protein
MAPRNLEQRASNEKNRQFAVSCVLGRLSGKKVPILPARRFDRRLRARSDRDFCVEMQRSSVDAIDPGCPEIHESCATVREDGWSNTPVGTGYCWQKHI